MKDILISIPVFGIALILQTAIISRMNILSGNADIILIIVAAWAIQEDVKSAWYWGGVAGLLVGFVSGLPWFVPLAGYLLTVGSAWLIQRRIWEAPLLAMFAVTFISTLVFHGLSYLVLSIIGLPLPGGEIFSLIILPSVLLNLLFSIPIHALIHELATRLYPKTI